MVMRKSLWEKGLVIGIIVVMVGSALPTESKNISEKRVKTSGLDDGLFSYWNFNEGNGDIAHDLTGNGHNGTVSNGTWVAGVSGTALEFHKTGNVIFNTFGLGKTWSASYWVKIFAYNIDSNAILGYSGNEYVTEIWTNTQKIITANSSTYWSESNPMNWTDGSWFHVVIVMNNGIATYYINGKNETSDSDFGNSSIRIRAIAGHGDPVNWLNGSLDEIRIYNRTLNESEIQFLYHHPGGGNQPPVAPIINGAVNGKINLLYNYTFNATDPDRDEVYYFIDWGDQTNSSWVGPHSSGTEITEQHSWSKKGTYSIKAKAKDIYGAESEWGTLKVTMPLSYNPPQFHLFEWLFERFPYAFPVLRHLLGY